MKDRLGNIVSTSLLEYFAANNKLVTHSVALISEGSPKRFLIKTLSSPCMFSLTLHADENMRVSYYEDSIITNVGTLMYTMHNGLNKYDLKTFCYYNTLVSNDGIKVLDCKVGGVNPQLGGAAKLNDKTPKFLKANSTLLVKVEFSTTMDLSVIVEICNC